MWETAVIIKEDEPFLGFLPERDPVELAESNMTAEKGI